VLGGAATVRRWPSVGMFRAFVILALLAVLLAAVPGCAEAPQTPPTLGPQPSEQWVPPFGADTVEDSSGHGNHGLVLGDTVRGKPGHQGTAYGFDEPGSWVEIFSDPSLSPRRHNFLISAWINFAFAPRFNNTFDIIRRGLSFTPSGMYKLELVSQGRARCTVKDTERRKARITSPQTGLADGTWHQIGCARVGSALGVVVDGVGTFKAAALGDLDPQMPLSVGSKYGTEDLPHGAVDDVLIIVGPPEPVALQREGLDERLAELQRNRPVGHWLLDEAAGPADGTPSD
jgi:hypothetical protein